METLPVELLHRIFDYLDAETILLSIRPVCRLFQAAVTDYDRYDINLELISKLKFYVLCRLIKPENIISLKISNDHRTSDQISLFISLVSLRKFTRLRSLNLINIDECQLDSILKRINLNCLTSFSFNIREYDDRRIKTTVNLLSLLIEKSSLQKLAVSIENERMTQISWPINCTIQYLIINDDINIYTLCKIFQCSDHLHTLIIKQKFDNIIRSIIPIYSSLASFQQLRSLTIEEFSENIKNLKLFLLLTPSLIYLKLIGGHQMFNGNEWEGFIKQNLPHLNKFEFYFHEWRSSTQNSMDLESIIASYRTPFWIEDKKWFVICEYYREYSSNIHLYSLPICKTFLKYEIKSEKNSLSNYPMMKKNDQSIMNNINSLYLTLEKSLADHIEEKKLMTNTCAMFPKVTEIELQYIENCSLLSFQSLSIFIDISQILYMKLNNYYFNQCDQNTWANISILMEQAKNLISLIVEISFYGYELHKIIENIHSIIPHSIKHIQIPIYDLNRIENILKRCQHLSTIKFDVEDTNLIKKIINWFIENTINSTCYENCKTVAIWLGKKKTSITTNEPN